VCQLTSTCNPNLKKQQIRFRFGPSQLDWEIFFSISSEIFSILALELKELFTFWYKYLIFVVYKSLNGHHI
jgi:hypothetical protein